MIVCLFRDPCFNCPVLSERFLTLAMLEEFIPVRRQSKILFPFETDVGCLIMLSRSGHWPQKLSHLLINSWDFEVVCVILRSSSLLLLNWNLPKAREGRRLCLPLLGSLLVRNLSPG